MLPNNSLKTILLLISLFLLPSCNGIFKKADIFSSSDDQFVEKVEVRTPADQDSFWSPITNLNPMIIEKKIKIAILLPLSGKHKNLGETMLNSITLSIFENDDDEDIELVIFDTKSSSIAAKKAMKEIAKQDIKVVLGPIFSSDVKMVADIARKNDIAILSFSNNQDLLRWENIFLMGFLPEQRIERMASFAIMNGKNNFAIIAPNNQYGIKFSNILKEMVRKKDGIFIASELYLKNEKDLNRAVNKAVNRYDIIPEAMEKIGKDITEEDKIYADVILVPESGRILAKIVSLINKHNKNEREIKIIGSSNWDNPVNLNNPDLIGSWFVSASPEQFRDFERKYYKFYKTFPPRISSIGYDAALAVIKAAQESGDRELSIDDFINYESSKNGFVGIDGLFRFLPNGIVQRNFAILEVDDSKFKMIDSPATMFFRY